MARYSRRIGKKYKRGGVEGDKKPVRSSSTASDSSVASATSGSTAASNPGALSHTPLPIPGTSATSVATERGLGTSRYSTAYNKKGGRKRRGTKRRHHKRHTRRRR